MNDRTRVSRKLFRALTAGLLLISVAVFALDLDTAKARGLVGETDAGYLAAVKPSPEVSSLIEEVNTRRQAEYRRIAEQNGIAVSDVEKLAAKKAIEKTEPGRYVMVNGNWRKK